MKESKFQSKVLDKIRMRNPNVEISKNDAGYRQGNPDFILLYGTKWAKLEFKDEQDASHRPNQDFYIAKANQMSFGRFIYPENEEEVLNELFAFFGI